MCVRIRCDMHYTSDSALTLYRPPSSSAIMLLLGPRICTRR
jgi:hypothetical protein